MTRSTIFLTLLLAITYQALWAATVPKTPVSSKAGRSVTDDADTLYDAIKSNDTASIMKVLLTQRTLEERLEISDYYTILHEQDLVDDLKDLLSGDLENTIVASLTPITTYYAGEINNAIAGLGTDEKSLTELLITLSNDQITATDKVYYSKYQEHLADAIAGDTDGFFKDFLTSLTNADRDEDSRTSESDAIDDAESLFAAKDFDSFNDVFSHRSYDQLDLVFEEYQIWAEEKIETTIEDNFSGDIKDAFLAVVEKVENEPAYFAQRFYESMEGLGTQDTVLIRLAVTRSEIDIEDVKAEYEDKYSTTLAKAIISETSGDYQKALLLLIGE